MVTSLAPDLVGGFFVPFGYRWALRGQVMRKVAALDDLIAFLIRLDMAGPLPDVLSSPLFPTSAERCAVLYGYAQGKGLTEADGLEPAWLHGHPSR